MLHFFTIKKCMFGCLRYVQASHRDNRDYILVKFAKRHVLYYIGIMEHISGQENTDQ